MISNKILLTQEYILWLGYDKCFKYFKKYGFDTDDQIHTQLIRYILIITGL